MKRYNIFKNSLNGCKLVEVQDKKGKWCKYEDYHKLEINFDRLNSINKELQKCREHIEQENKKMKALIRKLLKYTRHYGVCEVWAIGNKKPCTCGLDKIIQECKEVL